MQFIRCLQVSTMQSVYTVCFLLQQSQQLMEACEKGSLSEVRSLIERGASVHSPDEVSDVMSTLNIMVSDCNRII